jgi:hypothetical protein
MSWEIVGHWDYSGDPATSDKDHVRFLIQDVDQSDQLVSNEEIAFAISENETLPYAAVYLCRRIAARFAREADKTVSASGGLSTTQALSQRSRGFLKLAETLEAEISSSQGMSLRPYAGGVSVSDKTSVESDSDRTQPAFSAGMFDNHA